EVSDPTLPHARVKVAAGAGAQQAQELPTMPALKRLEGEQEVAVAVGEVGKAERKARLKAWFSRVQPSSFRSMVFAVLAVMLPVIVLIVLSGRPQKDPQGDGPRGKAAATAAAPSTVTAAPDVGTAGPAVTVVTSVPATAPVPE